MAADAPAKVEAAGAADAQSKNAAKKAAKDAAKAAKV